MGERHLYSSKPEPGYHERLEQAVDRYFVADPKEGVIFQYPQIFREHPELSDYGQHKELVDLINQTAITIYEYRTSEKLP